MIQLYEENGVYNMYLEMKVPGSDVEVTTADGTWRERFVHPWKDVGVLVKQQELDKQVRGKALKALGFLRQPKV